MHHIRRFAGALACSLTLALGLGASAQAHCSWALFPTIDPYPTGNQLTGIAGTGPRERLGDRRTPTAPARRTATRCTGTVAPGHRIKRPAHRRTAGQLSGVVAPGSAAVWAAGATYNAPGYAQPQALLEHWTGSGFSAVPAPAAPQAFSYLYGMAALGIERHLGRRRFAARERHRGQLRHPLRRQRVEREPEPQRERHVDQPRRDRGLRG